MQTDPIILPDMPVIESLSFRSVRLQDADAIYALRAGCIARDRVDLLSTSEGLPTLDEMREALGQIVAAGEQNQRLVAQVGDQVAGYSLIDSWREDDGHWVYLILGWVLPEWRGRGIGTAMLHWAEQTARRSAAEQHPGEPFEFAANASSTELDTTALLVYEGYAAGYTQLEMELDWSALPPVHPLPSGIELRPVLPEHYRPIAESHQEAYRHEYADDRFKQTWNLDDSLAALSDPRHDPTLWQVAWSGDQVVGDVMPLIEKGPDRSGRDGRALMFNISVRPAWRRQGLARALLTRALSQLRERRVNVVRLNTVAEFRTRARDLYSSVGFHVVKEFPRYRKSAK